MSRRVLRYDVPVDNQWHRHDVTGPVVHVAARRFDVVEIWIDSDLWDGWPDGHANPDDILTAEYRVFATGVLVEPGNAEYVGSALTAGGDLVWHLYKREVTT